MEKQSRWVTALLVAAYLAFGLYIAHEVGIGWLIEATPLKYLMPRVAEGAIPQTKLVYEGGSRLEDQIREVKRQLAEQLTEQGCQFIQFTVWREGEDIYIAAECIE
jgi:hypothetical protein